MDRLEFFAPEYEDVPFGHLTAQVEVVEHKVEL